MTDTRDRAVMRMIVPRDKTNTRDATDTRDSTDMKHDCYKRHNGHET